MPSRSKRTPPNVTLPAVGGSPTGRPSTRAAASATASPHSTRAAARATASPTAAAADGAAAAAAIAHASAAPPPSSDSDEADVALLAKPKPRGAGKNSPRAGLMALGRLCRRPRMQRQLQQRRRPPHCLIRMRPLLRRWLNPAVGYIQASRLRETVVQGQR